MGTGLAGLWSRAGHQVTISSRHPRSLVAVAGRLAHGVRVASVRDALLMANVVVIATPFSAVDSVLEQASELSQRIVVDITNPFERRADGSQIRLLPVGQSGASHISRRLPRARMVKAYSSIPARYLCPGAQYREGLPFAAFFCGDHPGACHIVGELISDSGFAPVDIGGLDRAGDIETDGSLQRLGLVPAPLALSLFGTPRQSRNHAA